MSISIVLCTYNGARYLAQQLDTLLEQTLQPDEIIIQDDGSNDATEAIALDYAARHPFIKFYHNPGPHGVNANFFSALRRAKSDLIAICDQDDLWMPDKLEQQVAAIGDNLMVGGISCPFSESSDTPVNADLRTPNIDALRMMFVGMIPGHTQLLRRQLLDMLPECQWFMYDLQTQMVAALHERLTMLPSVVVRQRRHLNAATYVAPRSRQRNLINAIKTTADTLSLYRAARPHIRHRFKEWTKFLDQLHLDTPSYHRARKMARLLSGSGIVNYLRLTAFCYHERTRLFHTIERDSILTKLRAIYFPIFCSTYYRYLVERDRQSQ